MNNISTNKYQASLSIEELLQQANPQQPQQNWLLTYLDVFVLIIMLVVTLMALSDFESREELKRAQTLQQFIEETTSKKSTESTPSFSREKEFNISVEKSNHNSTQASTSLANAQDVPNQAPSELELKPIPNKLIVEKTIEYIPEKLYEKPKELTIEKTALVIEEKKEITTEISNKDLISNQNQLNSQLSDAALNKQLQSTVDDLGLTDSVNMKVTQGYAQLEIQDNILFDSSESALVSDGENLLQKLTPLLTKSSGLIYIEGHTDNRPIKTEKFPSNWELGASRATSVLHFLASQNLDKSRLRAVTYADTKPIANNQTKEGRMKNRRVSIVIKVSDRID